MKPDLDKLLRAVNDGLTDGGLIADDARVVSIVSTKVETVNAHDVGVVIQVYQLDQDGEPVRIRPLHPYKT